MEEEKKKNIWIINHYAIPPSMGGLNRHYYFAKELIARGNSVRVFSASTIHNTSINIISDKENKKFKETEIDGLIYTFIKSKSYKGNGISRIKNMIGFMLSVKKIKKYFKNEKPNIIYTSSPDLLTAFSALRLAKKIKVPCVCEIRDLWPLSIVEYTSLTNSNPAIRLLYALEKYIYKKADALIFTMEGGKQYIRDKKWDKSIDLDKVFHINNGVDLEQQQCLRNKEAIDGDIFENGKFHVTYLGSIRKANNLGAIIDAAKVISEKDDNIEFIIYGDGTQREELENRCKKENINNVIFRGRVDKKFVPYICLNSDLNIMSLVNVRQTKIKPSKKLLISRGIMVRFTKASFDYGVSCNKLFDYMAAGKPILSTFKVKYDLIQKYDCGLTCENQDAPTIADAIIKIKELPAQEYGKMCENAKRAAEDYDFKILTDKLESVIEYTLLKDENAVY